MFHNVYIDDFVNSERYQVLLSSENSDLVTANWEQEDKLLVDLKGVKFFNDYTRWCDLGPTHYKVLIIRNFTHLDLLTETERQDYEVPAVASVYFLIGCMIKCLETSSGAQMQNLRIQRIRPEYVSFDYLQSQALDMSAVPQPVKGLKIVVDNTK